MKKVKAIFLTVVLCVCTAIFSVACGGGETAPSQSSSQTPQTSGEQTTQYTLAFSSENTDYGTVSAKTKAGTEVESGAKLDAGTEIVLTATPSEGYAFDGWYSAGQKASTETAYTVTLTSDCTYQAKFVLNGYTLSFLSENTQKGTILAESTLLSGAIVPYKTQITLTATANTGYEFLGWYEDGGETLVATTATYSFSMPAKAYALTAKFTEKFYALAYATENAEHGSVESALENGENVPYKTQVVLTATPNEGYSFLGWYEDGNNVPVSQSASYAFSMPAKAYSLTAKFTAQGYTLSYAVDDADRGEISSATASGSTVGYQTQVTLTATEKVGYDFVGWYVAGSDTPIETSTTYTFTMPASAYSVTANFAPEKRYVYFNDGYDRVHTETVDYNTPVTLYTISKDNYNFLGWFTSPSFNTVYDENQKVTENITLYARWEALIITHDVVFVNDDGSTIGGVQKIVEGESIIMRPANPSKTGYNFTGWVYYDDEQNELPLTDQVKVYSDMTIHASYEIQTFAVNFYLSAQDRDPYLSYEIEYNKKANRPTTPTKDDELFVKWVYFDNADAEFDFNTQITEAIDVLAVWVEKPAETFTVTFYKDQGVVWDTQTVEKDSAATAPADPEKEGYDFAGWNTDFDCITADTAVYATYTVKTFKVVFEDHDGSVLKAEQTVNYNASAIAPNNPTRAGYEFIGWSCAFTNVTEDLTVVAQYEIHTFTVVFQEPNGNELGRQEVDYNAVVPVPATPSKAGHSFIGWYVEETLTNTYNFNTPITEDTEIFARFDLIVIDKFTVTFRQPDGTVISQQSVVEGNAAIEPSAPVKEGYTFTGWDKTFGNITSDLEVTAEYDINRYAVRFFDAEGEQIGETQYVNYNQTAADVEPNAPPVANKEFSGWDKDIDNLRITKATDFYAVYVNETRTVYFYTDTDTFTTVTVEYGATVNIPNTPSKAGYVFQYWYLEDEDVAFDFSTAIIEDTYLYAKYDVLIDKFTVEFIGLNGDPYGNVQIVAKDRYAIEPAPYEDGTATEYVWCLENEDTAFDFERTPITENITLYAKPKTAV